MAERSQAHRLRPSSRCATAGAALATLTVLTAGCASPSAPPPAAPRARTAATAPAHAASQLVSWRGLHFGRLPELRSTGHLARRPWTLLGTTGGNTLLLAVPIACGLPPAGERVQQAPAAVTVAVYAHRLPAGDACSQALGTAFIAVTLATPLAGRRLLQ